MKSIIVTILSLVTTVAFAQECFTGSTVLTATPSATTNQVSLSWLRVSDASGWDFNSNAFYFVNYGIGNTGTLSSGTSGTSNVLTNLTLGATYLFRIGVSKNCSKSDGSGITGSDVNVPVGNTSSVTIFPAVPTISNSISNSSTTIDFSWNTVSGATGYDVEITNATGTVLSNPLNVSGALFTATGLTPNTSYFYRVRARNSGGTSLSYSSKSAAIFVRPDAPILPATSASSITSTSFQINWNPVSGTGAVTYRLDVSSDQNFNSFITSDMVVTGTASPVINGLTGGTRYYYRIRAVNVSGPSSSSTTGQVLTAPNVPTGFSVSSATPNSITVNWVAVATATAYELFVASDQAFSSPLANYNPKVIDPATLSEAIGELAVSTTYYLKLRAKNGTNIYSDFANTSSATTASGTNGIQFKPTSPASYAIGSMANILTDVTGTTGNVTVHIQHKKNSESVYTAEPLVPVTGVTYKIQLNDSWFDSFGMEYYLEAQDQVSQSTSGSPNAPVRISTAIANAAVPLQSFGTALKNYQIISIPYDLPGRSHVSDIFELIMGEYDKKKWRLFQYQNGANVEYSDGLKASNLKQGESYWLISKNEVQLSFGQGISNNLIDDKASFTLSIKKGWNQIGNPFPYNLSWQAVIDDNQNANVNNTLYVFDEDKASLVAGDLLKAFGGGFVFADNDTELFFRVSLPENSGGRISSETRTKMQASANKDGNSGNWILPITLSQGEVTNSVSGIGMNGHAADGQDSYDNITPPRFIRFLEFNSWKNDFGYNLSQDIVSVKNDYRWNFIVESDSDEPVQIKWDQQSSALLGGKLILYDQTEKIIINMGKLASYATQSGARISIYYSQSQELEADKIELGKPYPNPFQNELIVPFAYTVNESYSGEFGIYDLQGRKLFQQEINSKGNAVGIQNIRWDGNTQNGDKLAAGAYVFLLKIKKGNEILSFHEKIIKQ